MSKIRICLSLLLLFLLVMPLVALAQEDEDSDWVEFTSDDEVIMLSYPRDWEYVYSSPAFINLRNNPELSEELGGDKTTQDLQVGEHTLLITTFPAKMLLGTSLDPEMTVEEITEFAKLVFIGPALEADPPPTISEITVVEINDEVEIGYFIYSTAEQEDAEATGGLVLAFASDDLLTVGHLTTTSGEYSEALQQLVFEMVATYQVQVTAEELESLYLEMQSAGTAEPGS